MAESIGEAQARRIAEEFFAEHATRGSVGSVALAWAGDDIANSTVASRGLDTSLIYIYSHSGGGFVIVSGDSNTAPIIAYSMDNDIDIANMSEATEAILDAWCRAIAVAREEARPISGAASPSATQTRSSSELLYQTAQWNQTEPFNREAPIYDNERSLTGCVATAMSIICRYHKWPQKGVGTTPEYTYNDANGVTRTVAANTLGRTYNYNYMPLDYNSGYTDTQGNAVAALMKDIGTSVRIMYHPTSSGTYDHYVPIALFTYFGYSNSLELAWHYSYEEEEWQEIVRNNIREYGPTYFSGSNSQGGHAFVLDGYDSNGRFHINYGWGGLGNGYYFLPNIDYYAGQAALLYLEPNRSGAATPYRDNLQLSDYSKTDSEGNTYNYSGIWAHNYTFNTGEPIYLLIGAIMNHGYDTFNGDVRLVLCNAQGDVKEEIWTTQFTDIAPNSGRLLNYQSITLSSTLEDGDRLRLLYKGTASDEWQWMRSADRSAAHDEIIVRASAEDIAENLTLHYNKEDKSFIILSPLPMRVEFVNNSSGYTIIDGGVRAYVGGYIDMTSYVDGSYTLRLSLGSDAYEVKIKL